MKHHLRAELLFTVIVVIGLLLAAVTPSPAYAEGDIPEAPPEPVVEETAPVDAASAVELLAESGAVIAAPDGSGVPLASQAALDVICEPDPWFYCSVGCAGGKSGFFATIMDAVTYWSARKGYGYIYLEGGYLNSSQNVTINGAAAGMNTLKGIVWDQKSPGKPEVKGLINISGFTSGFKLQGISVTIDNPSAAAVFLYNNSGTINLTDVSVKNISGSGITIINKGPVVLNSVTAKENYGSGVTIYNTEWSVPLNKNINYGNVTITNSNISRNGSPAVSGNYDALMIESAGSILLNGVTAIGNSGNGALLKPHGASLVIKNSIFSQTVVNPVYSNFGNGIFVMQDEDVVYTAAITLDNVILEGNYRNGATLYTTGNVTLSKVYAANNGGRGVYISTYWDMNGPGAKNVTVSNSNFFSNAATNLEIYATGAVKIMNLHSTHSDSGDGLYVDNSVSATPMPVTVLGAVVNGNAIKGMNIFSKRTVTLSGITSLGNGYGSFVYNGPADAVGGVTISGALGLNRFNNSTYGHGLFIQTRGNVNLASVQANENTSNGIQITGLGDVSNVTLVNVEVSSNEPDAFAGLHVETSGTVLLERVTALGNAGAGIRINSNGPGKPLTRPVTIRNSVASDNEDIGIQVKSAGLITLYNVTANGNGDTGADLQNYTNIPPGQLFQAVNVSRSTFNENDAYGLFIYSARKISLASIYASGNTYSGVFAGNAFLNANSPISVSGTNTITHNGVGSGLQGLYMESNGAISISGVNASWNGNTGIYARSTYSGATITNVKVVGNITHGISLGVSGNTTLNMIQALQNGTASNADGINISSSAGKVTISNSLIMGNSAWGLNIDVVNPSTDIVIGYGVVVFGNDARSPYTEGDYWPH